MTKKHSNNSIKKNDRIHQNILKKHKRLLSIFSKKNVKTYRSVI